MNYYRPLPRLSDGRFDFTVTNDGNTHPVGYCQAYHTWQPEDIRWWANPETKKEEAERLEAEQAPFRQKYHTDGHATPEEAAECYRQYELDQLLVFYDDLENADTLRKCEAEGCEEYTSGTAFVNSWHMWYLCAKHRTREEVEKQHTRGSFAKS